MATGGPFTLSLSKGGRVALTARCAPCIPRPFGRLRVRTSGYSPLRNSVTWISGVVTKIPLVYSRER